MAEAAIHLKRWVDNIGVRLPAAAAVSCLRYGLPD